MKKTSVRTTIPLALLGAIAAVSLLVLACEADPPTRPADEAVEAAIPDQTAESLPLVIPDQVGGDRPLIVVDGVIVSTGSFDDLQPESIERVEVLKGAAAFERYGSRAQHGVIQITTHDGAGATQDPAALEDSAVLDAEEEATPVISGGVVVDRRGTTYHVLGGTVEGARVRSGDDASPQVLLRDAGRDGSRDDESPQILLRDAVREGFEEGDRPLLIVDGVIVDDETASEIAPQGIASVEIVKGAAAAQLYGTRAANGVIQITTRR